VVVNGRPIVDQVIENLGLDEDYDSMLGKITLNNPSDSRILEITVTDPDPQRAKLIADEMAEVSSAFIAEKMDQDPPSIIQYGYADGDKVSPSIRKNTVIGALIGMILAIAAVVVIYLLNDTIMTQEDVERKLGLTLLGTLPLEEDGDEPENKKKRRKG
jgi:capsular polysaccharide biosynthesis protein